MGSKYVEKKPILLMCIGTGWSATSPLYYTLGDWNRYCHCGIAKENKYLEHIHLYNNKKFYLLDRKKVSFRRVLHSFLRDKVEDEKYRDFGLRSRPKQVTFKSKVNKHWDRDYLSEFLSQPHTFEKYIDYYKKLWKAIVEDGKYHAVSDFTVQNIYFPEEFVKEFANEIRNHFDVKIIITCRDPVRRSWSQNQFRWFQRGKTFNCQDPWHLYWQSLLSNDISYNYEDIDFITLYTEGYRRWSEAFGKENVHVTVMEQLWERNGDKWGGKEAMEKLSDFISYKIDNMFPNVYVPDMKSKAPKLKYLSDQWMSDQVNLSYEQEQVARRLMDKAYTQWELVFGSIPKEWMTLDKVKVSQLNKSNPEQQSKTLMEVMEFDPGCLPTTEQGKNWLKRKQTGQPIASLYLRKPSV